MIETFTALLCAHVAADFLFQTRQMALGKATRHPVYFAGHIATLAVLSALALAPTDPVLAVAPLGVVVASHLAIDLAKSFAPQDRARIWRCWWAWRRSGRGCGPRGVGPRSHGCRA